jgi:hypothetical protein
MSENGVEKPEAEESLLWWRHPFFRLRWKQWYANWRKLAGAVEAHDEGGVAHVLSQLAQANCDPEVALRLAFLEASQKPTTKSELAGDNERQQKIRRKLTQARNRLWKAMALHLELASQPRSDTGQRRITRKVSQARNHIEKAALELEHAFSDVTLILIKPERIESLKAMADMTETGSVASLRTLAQLCDHEVEALKWPLAVELPPGHELFMLVSYITACSGEPHFATVTDLLDKAYQAYNGTRSPTVDPLHSPTQEAIEKQVQRFRRLRERYLVLIDMIEESTARWAKSGEFRRELLACYPDQ